jgi:hypothetical protein
MAAEITPVRGRDTRGSTDAFLRFFCILENLETKKMIGNGPFNPAKNLFVPSLIMEFIIYHKMQFKIVR